MAKQKFENFNKWGMLGFTCKSVQYLCIYDFQEMQVQIVKPSFNVELTDYSYVFKTSVIFVAGGVERELGAITNKAWVASPGEVTEFTQAAPMNAPRGRPFLVYPNNSATYAISGFYAPQSPQNTLRSCEKYCDGQDRWSNLPSLSRVPERVFAVAGYLYSFVNFEDKMAFERLNSNGDEGEWLQGAVALATKETTPHRHYAVTCVRGDPAQLLIFGGADKADKPMREVFGLKVFSGELAKERGNMPEKVKLTECYTDTDNCTCYITADLQLCVYRKETGKWAFADSKIREKAKQMGLSVTLQ